MAMKDRALIMTGAAGAVLAAICCAAPLLAVVLGAFSFTAWFAKAAYAVIPALVIGLGLVGLRFFRRRSDAACGAPPIQQQDTKS